MLAFGHFVLPIAAIVALGLLFVGIKLFFLTPGNRDGIEVTPTPPVVAVVPDVPVTDTPGDEPDETSVQPVVPEAPTVVAENPAPPAETPAVLAGPVGPGASSSGGANAQTARPSGGTPTTPRPSDTAQPSTANRPRVSPNVRWGVQIGAFQKEEGAKTVIDEVSKAGYTATMSTAKNSSGTTFYRVRVAAGNNKDDAAKLAVELEKKGYPVLVVSN